MNLLISRSDYIQEGIPAFLAETLRNSLLLTREAPFNKVIKHNEINF